MNTKGIQGPFQWMFTVLVGGFILIMTISLINGGMDAVEARSGVELLQRFDMFFDSVATLEEIDITLSASRSVHLEITCDLNNNRIFSDFRVRGTTGRDIQNTAIFSRGTVSGSNIFIRTKNFNNPFTIGSVVAVTDSETAYVVVGNTPAHQTLEQRVRDLLPRNATLFRFGAYDNPNLIQLHRAYDYVVVISIDALTNSVHSRNTHLLQIQDNNRIVFRSVDSNGLFGASGTSFERIFMYKNDAELLGAIVSGSAGIFECNREKLNRRQASLFQFLSKRVTQMQTVDSRCDALYTQAILAFSTQDVEELQRINRNLEVRSCALLY